MSTPQIITERYLGLWNTPDDDDRRARLSREWHPDARYVDPMMNGVGHDGIAAMITAARAQFPGHAFTLVGVPDGHGAFVRFAWALSTHDADVVARGTDVVRLDTEGRIVEVTGFLDAAPEADA